MSKRAYTLFNKEISFTEYRHNIDEAFIIDGVKAHIDRVFIILIKNEQARDSYKHLVSDYLETYYPWCSETYLHPTDWILSKGFPQFNTVIRCRSLLQDKFIELRGKNYKDRMEQYQHTKDNWYSDDGPGAEV
jgi:hypothetical protein